MPSLTFLPGRPRALLGLLTAIVACIALTGTARAAAYQNPFTAETPYVGRTDMGVDLCLTRGQPVRAVGNGVVTGIMRDWTENEPYLWYQLTDGPDAGRHIYVAEQITHLARVGQTLHAGDTIARYAAKGTCIETGWSEADGDTVAQGTTGYTEGEVTKAGISFAHFLISLGVPGAFELTAPKPAAAQTRARHRRHRR